MGVSIPPAPPTVAELLLGHEPGNWRRRWCSTPPWCECAAFGLPDARWGELVAAAVVLQPGAQPGEGEWQAHLQQRLARFKVPRRWFFLPQLPKTALGKVQRGELVRPFLRGVS